MGNLGISIVDEDSSYTRAVNESCPTVIKVVGCGGGGSNAVNRMISRSLGNVEFIVLNTDLQALGKSKAHVKLPIGQKITEGLGAGGNPAVGEKAAEEDKDNITDILRGANMVFITAGMGGGTGTGSAPIVARIAKDLGCLTVAVVTTPFEFEGPVRMRNAQEGLKKLHEQVDSLIVIPNELLYKNVDTKLTIKEAFTKADEVLCQGVEGISNIITNPGDVNTDFADVKNAMSGQGNAIFGIGVAEGENRAFNAANSAINNPMLENSNINGAKNLLVNICASEEITLDEVGEIIKIVSNHADSDYNMFWGQVTQPELKDKISVTVIATGFETNSNANKSEEKIQEREILTNRDDVADLSGILGGGSKSSSLGGDFVTKHDVTKEPDNEDKQGSLSKAIFSESASSYGQPVKRSFIIPVGTNLDPSDLSTPPVWLKNADLNRTIKLTDD